MPERDWFEQLGPELAAIAEVLRDAPAEHFRLRLKEELMQAVTTPNESKGPSYLPEGMHSINPYLVVRGAAALLDFIAATLGGQERLRVPLPDGSLMHSEIGVGDSVIEIADANARFAPVEMSLHVYVPDIDAAFERALQAGAESLYPVTDQPYGDREGGLKHPSGITFFIATHQGEHYIPEHLRDVTIGLNPVGAAGLLEFAKQAFDAEEVEVHRGPSGAIGHAKVRIGDSVFELSESHGQWKPMPANLHLYVPDVDETYRRALAAGATSQRPPTDEPYGDRAAGVVDAWGNQWWLATYQGSR